MVGGKWGRVLTALGLGAALAAVGCRGGELSISGPGEPGEHRTYGARFVIVDDGTGRPLPGVRIVVKSGPVQEAFRGQTDARGRANFIKGYFRRRIRNYGSTIGYPDGFLVVCEREGYKTLRQSVLIETFEVDTQGAPWYPIRMVPGKGTIVRREKKEK